MRIFLIGYMGSGKTSLGKSLASKLKYKFIDLDFLIESEENLTVPQIFKEKGESYFRKLEYLYLRKIFDQQNIVVSTGGGTPCFFDNMDQMNKNGKTIYINLDPKSLFNRLKKTKPTRPLLEGKSDKQIFDYILKSLRSRVKYYNKAHNIVSGYNLTAQKLYEFCFQD